MNTEKLIEIAKKCGDRSINCTKECPYFTQDANCVANLLYDMADRLEEKRKEE